VKVLQLLFLTGYVFCLNAWCPQTDSSWQTLSNHIKLNRILNEVNDLDESCFISIISDLPAAEKGKTRDKLVEVVKKWIKGHKISAELLVSFYKSPLIYNNRDIWPAVFSVWEKTYVSVDEAYAHLAAKGLFHIADTLYDIYDKEDKLNVFNWLKWAKLKNITGDNDAIGSLYCRIISSESKLTPIALSQFRYLLKDQKMQVADSILSDFLRCFVYRSETDTVQIREWTSQTCSELGLYNRQIEILKTLNTENYPVYGDLFYVSTSHLSNKRYRYAVDAAKVIYNNSREIENKQKAAFLIYESFRDQNLNDSALMWLKRVNLQSSKQMIDAATLYQNAGLYDKAQEIIDSIPRSYAVDTMLLRQFLFTGKRNEAYNMTKKGCCNKDLLWTVRTALFEKKFLEVNNLLDSVSYDNITSKGELLSCRYWLQRLQGSSDLLDVWAQIEYNIYIGNFNDAVNLLSAVKESDRTWELALRVAKVLINRGDSQTALNLLKQHERSDISAEFLYSMAEAMLCLGETDKGRQILEKIMLEYSDDIYSGRARLLLLSK